MLLDEGRNRNHARHLLIVFLAVVLALAAVLPAAGREPIPTDGNGLPLWVERTWNDFPVSLELADAAAVARLLDTVPIASFEREQLIPDPTTGRLVFTPRITAEEAAALSAAGYEFTRLPDREQEGRRAVEAFWAEQAAKGFTATDPAKALYYPTHAQIGTDLAALAGAHRDLARTFTMGTSVQGRAMWGIVISDDVQATEAEPEVRLTSSIHGDETVGMVMLWNLAHYLLDNYGQPGFEAVTDLVDNTEIHIMPLHNPDGYVAGTRGNANGVDLNRNFPEPAGTHGTTEVENLDFMAYAASHHFVISQNTHGGALVVNYPWDYTYTRAPDDAALIQLSLAYSTTNLPMYNSPSFPQGITNGADWYVANGTLQDWSYDQTDCIDVTVEISNTKWPAATALDGFWEDNRQSLLNYVAAAHQGVNGVVTAADTGLPLAATVTVVGNTKPVSTDPEHGDYYKLLPTGNWQLIFSAPGYLDEVASGVATTWGTPTVLDVALDPVAHGDLAGAVTAPGGAALDATIAIFALPLDQYVTSLVAPGGVYATTLPYGDYRVEASATGHATVAQQVTVGATPVTADFVLGAIENVELFASDFEADMAGWSGGWGLSTGGVGYDSSGSLTDSPGVNYADNITNIVTMDQGVDLDGVLTAQLSFWATWAIEPTWDACFCEVSVNGGQSWTALATSYTGPASGQGGQTPAGAPCFDDNQLTWVRNTVSLAPYIGQPDVSIRFRLATDTSVNRAGFTLDDFRITATRLQDILSPVPGAGPVTLSVSAWPNPFNPSTTVAFSVPRSGLVELRIYDLRGRMVRALETGHLEAGTHRRTWDGRDTAGSPVGSGVYFAQARVGAERAVTKLMLVK